MIPEFDIMTTATLRPELLKRTFDSFIENMFGEHIKKATLNINIDGVGSKEPEKAWNEIIQYLDSIPFKKVNITTNHKPSFSRAFFWLLGQISEPLTFNLEEDWELRTKVDFEKMVSLMENDKRIVHLRLSAFKCDGSDQLKTWNKYNKWNGSFYEIPRNLRGTIGWAGHPSLNRTAFLLFFSSIFKKDSNPEKQIKGAYPIILENRFGVFHPKKKSDPAIYDIGRKWMIENKYQKKGIKAFFTNWEKRDE